MKLSGLCIEVNQHNQQKVVYLIKNFFAAFPQIKQLYFFCGQHQTRLYTNLFCKNKIDTQFITIQELEWTQYDRQKHHNFIKSKTLWDMMEGDYVITMSVGGYFNENMSKFTLDYFMKYDFIGGTFNRNQSTKGHVLLNRNKDNIACFQGNFSIRNRKQCVRVIEQFPTNKTCPTYRDDVDFREYSEDYYFVNGMHRLGMKVGMDHIARHWCSHQIMYEPSFCYYNNQKSKTWMKQQETNVLSNGRYKKNILIDYQNHFNFIDEIVEKMKEDFNVIICIWKHEEKQKRLDLLNWADIIFCEWCEENALWYSQNKKNHQKLYIRLHRYELFTSFFYKINWKNVNNLIFISPEMKRLANKHLLQNKYVNQYNFDWEFYLKNNNDLFFNIDKNNYNKIWAWNHWINYGNKMNWRRPVIKLTDDIDYNIICKEFKHFNGGELIRNYIKSDMFTNLPKFKGSEFNIGIVGILPKIKRPDIALDIIENLIKKDKRYKLFILGKRYTDWIGTSKCKKEVSYYEKLEERINSTELKDHVIFDDFTFEVHNWFQKIGFILSVSDIEGCHQSVAEAMATGTIPLIYGKALKEYKLDEVYPKKYCFYEDNVDKLCSQIIVYSHNKKDRVDTIKDIKKISNDYHIVKIYPKIINIFNSFALIKNLLSKKIIKKSENNNKILISGIFDTFTKTTFENYFNIVDFNIDDSSKNLIYKLKNINFFFIETSWNFKGIQLSKPLGKAQTVIFNQKSIPLLKRIKDTCKILNKKIIVWNKEDPTNYERFSYLIEYADYFVTSDNNMIDKYKHDYNKDVLNMGFFIDPYIHNPINKNNIFDICFAGRQYPMHKNRMNDSNFILREVTKKKHNLNLILFDRINDKNRDDSFLYYNEFQSYVYGKLTYEEVLHIYKYFKVIINLNTVQDSQTMFARRVYEICGYKQNCITNFSKGIKKKFKHFFILEESNKNKLTEYLSFINKKKVVNEYYKHLDWRKILLNESFETKINTIFSKCNLNQYKLTTISNQKILILKFKRNNNNSVKFKNCNYDIIEINNIEQINNYKKEFVKYDYISFMSDNNFYNENYIIDNLLLLYYSPYTIISKPNSISYEYQIIKGKEVDLFSTIIKNNLNFEIRDEKIVFQNKKEILYSDRFSFVKNISNNDTLSVLDYKIKYTELQHLKINLNEDNKLFYNNKEISLKKGIHNIVLEDIEENSFYFENNCSVDFCY